MIIIIVLVLIFAFLAQKHQSRISFLLIVSVIILSLAFIAGTRTQNVGRDIGQYINYFEKFSSGKFEKEDFIFYEISTVCLPHFFNIIFGESYLGAIFLFYAFLGIITKFLSFNHNTFFLSAAIYVTYFFFSQEMITIRAGVSCGIFLLAIPDIEKKKDLLFFCKIGVAYLFHFSSLVFLVPWLINKLKIKTNVMLIALALSIVVAIFKIDILTLFRLDLISVKVLAYMTMAEEDKAVPVNIFNFRILFSVFFLVLFILKYKMLSGKKYFRILFHIHLLSLIFFFLMSASASVFSLRVYDLLSIVQIILYPYIIYIFRERWASYSIILGFCVINFAYVWYASEWFVNGYSSWFFKLI